MLNLFVLFTRMLKLCTSPHSIVDIPKHKFACWKFSIFILLFFLLQRRTESRKDIMNGAWYVKSVTETKSLHYNNKWCHVLMMLISCMMQLSDTCPDVCYLSILYSHWFNKSILPPLNIPVSWISLYSCGVILKYRLS